MARDIAIVTELGTANSQQPITNSQLNTVNALGRGLGVEWMDYRDYSGTVMLAAG